ncbi:uncharacterized protein LOC103572661 isoform X2 [Microplitis demolitor]|uniref:uncharacterized protein LOC103572661 isoform X2 n=1 Tax=Microplitis demolitor TaxID=69319 RepID=UPI0004CCC7AC|nr:uncharacterized protein LOC103572661 isoform X2 [Microplitis demolitor]
MERTRNYQRIANDTVRNKISSESDFGPRKTIFVLTVVAGCFAILWPKIFYPMLNGPANTVHSPIDGSACCDLIFENDINAVDILQEMCKNILNYHQVDPRVRDIVNINKLPPQSINFCREQVLLRCGIDLSSFLAKEEKLGKTYKQVLQEIRSFNSSLCLKINFGVSISRLGTPHLIRYHILMSHTPIKQERRIPPHAGGLHPAMRERGRAIPSSHIVPRVEGRPEQVVVQKMRPPMGGPGRVITPHAGGSSMGIIMPLYTVGILLFFLYTISKILRKNSNNEIYPEYTNPEAEREFRDRVFNPKILTTAMTGMPYYRKEKSPESIRRTPTIEELKHLIDGPPKSNDPADETLHLKGECLDSSCCSIGRNEIEELDRSSPTVKVMGMEMTANCEGGQKISRPSTPTTIHSLNHSEREKTPPKPIYLEGALPSQCELLVTDSKTQTENLEENAGAPIVLSGKMTLSLISLDQISANSKEINGNIDEHKEKIVKIVPENYNALDESKQVDLNNDKIAIDKSKNMLNKKKKENENIDEDGDEDKEDNDYNSYNNNDDDDDDKKDDEDVIHDEDVDNDNDDNNDNYDNDDDDGDVNDNSSKKISSKDTMLF